MVKGASNMRLPIYNDKYIIKSDPRQFLLYEIREKQKKDVNEDDDIGITDNSEETEGEDKYLVFIAACSTISQIIKHLIQREKRISDSTTWKEYFVHLQEIEKRFNKIYADIIEALGEDVLDKKIEQLPEGVVKHGEPEGEPKKRGRTKKE